MAPSRATSVWAAPAVGHRSRHLVMLARPSRILLAAIGATVLLDACELLGRRTSSPKGRRSYILVAAETGFTGYESCPCLPELRPADQQIQNANGRFGYGVGRCWNWDEYNSSSACPRETGTPCLSNPAVCGEGGYCNEATGQCMCDFVHCAHHGTCHPQWVTETCAGNLSSSEKGAWCSQPWCYVNLSMCANYIYAEKSSTMSAVIGDVGFSYQTCGGRNLWNMDVYLVIQDPRNENGHADPYWENVVKGLQGTFQGSIKSTSRPKDPWEEQDAVQQIITRQMKAPDVKTKKLGNRFNRTVVIAAVMDASLCAQSNNATAASHCQFPNDGWAYEPILQTDASVIFLEVGPNPQRAHGWKKLPYVLMPDNQRGGESLGRQFCSSVHQTSTTEIILLKGTPGSRRCEERVEGFMRVLNDEEMCPGFKPEFIPVHANWSYSYAVAIMDEMLTNRPLANVVFSCNSLMALGAADVASARGLSEIKIIAYDYFDKMEDYIADKRVMMTVDQQVGHAGQGLPDVALLVASNSLARDNGPASRGMVVNVSDSIVDKDSDCIVETPVRLVVRDMPALIRQNLLDSYGTGEGPDGVVVTAYISKAQMVQFDINQQTFSAVVDLVFMWKDLRLTWDCDIHDFEIELDPSAIWIPADVFDPVVNPTEEQEVVSSTARTNCKGNVVSTKRQRLMFTCDFTRTLAMYPFDEHYCPTTWSVPPYTLVVAGGKLSQPKTVTVIGWAFSIAVNTMKSGDKIRYTFKFTRLYIRFYVAFFLPCAMLNIISFQQFWIAPTHSIDRAGLAATTLLSAILLRESADLPDGIGTLAIYYWLVSLVFHFCALCCTVFGRRVGNSDEGQDLDSIVLRHIERAMQEQSHTDEGNITDLETCDARSPLSDAVSDSTTSQDTSLRTLDHKIQNSRYRIAMRVTGLLGYYRQSSWDLIGKRVIVPMFSLFLGGANIMFVTSHNKDEDDWFNVVVLMVSVIAGVFFLYWLFLMCFVFSSRRYEYLALTVGYEYMHKRESTRLLAFFFPGKFRDKLLRQQVLMRSGTGGY
eukprot:TRINITY_DN8298_c0_g1_i1.p1 TRINITY_DN8298_c0_g1~~TRINITY_DN8298_c0_g1_i1.p1  ORF type:complete len:1042 (+),score=125.28 TRINITY_DN8298_c0_g1_i1:133-3258(+)